MNHSTFFLSYGIGTLLLGTGLLFGLIASGTSFAVGAEHTTSELLTFIIALLSYASGGTSIIVGVIEA